MQCLVVGRINVCEGHRTLSNLALLVLMINFGAIVIVPTFEQNKTIDFACRFPLILSDSRFPPRQHNTRIIRKKSVENQSDIYRNL